MCSQILAIFFLWVFGLGPFIEDIPPNGEEIHHEDIDICKIWQLWHFEGGLTFFVLRPLGIGFRPIPLFSCIVNSMVGLVYQQNLSKEIMAAWKWKQKNVIFKRWMKFEDPRAPIPPFFMV